MRSDDHVTHDGQPTGPDRTAPDTAAQPDAAEHEHPVHGHHEHPHGEHPHGDAHAHRHPAWHGCGRALHPEHHEHHGGPGFGPREHCFGPHRLGPGHGGRGRPTLARSIVKSARRIRHSDLTPEQLQHRIAATVSHADYVTTMRTLRRIGTDLRHRH